MLRARGAIAAKASHAYNNIVSPVWGQYGSNLGNKFISTPLKVLQEAPHACQPKIQIACANLDRYVYIRDNESEPNDDSLPGDGRLGRFGIAPVGCMGCNWGRQSSTSEDPERRGMQEALIPKKKKKKAGGHRHVPPDVGKTRALVVTSNQSES